jgi:hypothetical protein
MLAPFTGSLHVKMAFLSLGRVFGGPGFLFFFFFFRLVGGLMKDSYHRQS